MDIHNYLDFVHDIPVESYLGPNRALAAMLAAIPLRKVIYTNATVEYSWRVLRALDVADQFERVIGIEKVGLRNKRYRDAYEQVLALLDASGPECIMIEDTAHNLWPAKAVGMTTLVLCLLEPLVTSTRPRPGANLFIVLADDSRSLTIRDAGSAETRHAVLRRSLAEDAPWLTRLEQDFDVLTLGLQRVPLPQDVLADHPIRELGVELLGLPVVEEGQIATLLLTPLDRLGHNPVCFPKRNAALHEEIRELGGEAEIAEKLALESRHTNVEFAPHCSQELNRRCRAQD